MTPKRTRIIALILVGVLVFGLAATGISALLMVYSASFARRTRKLSAGLSFDLFSERPGL